MKNAAVAFLILFLLVWNTLPALAQSERVIRTRNLLGFYKYHYAGQKLSEKEFLEVLKSQPQAYDLLRTARKNNLWGTLIGSTGMFLILTQLNPPYFNREINPAVIAPGVILFGAGLHISIKYLRQSGLALDLYNEAQFSSGYSRPKAEIQLGLMGTGLGLQVKF